MFLELLLVTVCVLGLAGAAEAAEPRVDTVETSAGPLRIVCIGHGSVRFEWNGSVIDVDPFGNVGEYAAMRPVREVVLCPARFCEDKDHETLLRAFEVTVAKRPRAELWLVGDGPLRPRVRTLAARSPVRGNIRTYPAAPDPRPFFEQASVVTLSSVREGLPNVILEAMMSMASVARKPTSCSREVVTSFKSPSVEVWKTCCT